MSLILEDTGEKTTLQKGDRVVAQLLGNGFLTISCSRKAGRLLRPIKDDKWLVFGGKHTARDIILILSDIYDIAFKQTRETKVTVSFTVL